MPIYEYVCVACGHNLEKLQKLSDSPLIDCPNCGEASLQKQVSAAGFRLKGGGWYETDFKAGNKKNLAGGGADSKPDKGSGASADSKKESKTTGKSGTSSSKE